MDHPPSEVDTKRQNRNWKRRQRRKAAKKKARLRYFALRTDLTSTKDPNATNKGIMLADYRVTDSSEEASNQRNTSDSTQREDMVELQEIKFIPHSKPLGATDRTTGTGSSDISNNTSLQLDNNLHKLISEIQMRIRRLEKLHELRRRLLLRHFWKYSKTGETKFTLVFENLMKKLRSLLVDLNAEEAMDGNNKKIVEAKTNYGKSNRVPDIEVALFGGKRHIPLHSAEELVDVRRQWDAYESTEGQTVPVRWVEAPKEPTEEWAEYLVQ